MQAFYILALFFLVPNVRSQSSTTEPSVPTQGNPTNATAGPSNLGTYSPEQICAQGPGMMQGQPVFSQGGLFGISNGVSNNPCTVTCQNQQVAWMVAKPHGAPCRIPSDPLGERYCLNQICVGYNSSLNAYCRQTLNVNTNSPDYMALMPYGCTVACLDKSTPSVVQVQFANGMACHVNTPDRRVAQGYCMNGACSTLTFRSQGGFIENLLDPRLGAYPGQNPSVPSGNYPGSGYYNPFPNFFGGFFGG